MQNDSNTFAPPPLGLSTAGLPSGPGAPWGSEPARLLAWIAGRSLRWVSLDVSRPGFKLSELDASGRRGVARAMRKLELQPVGVETWIPERHWLDSATVDRAAAIVLDAAEFAETLGGRRVVSVTFPADLDRATIDAMSHAASSRGVMLANHAVHKDGLATSGPIGVDPASLLTAGHDLAGSINAAADRIVAARLADASAASRRPTVVGEGSLDVLQYAAVLGIIDALMPVVIDVRGLNHEIDAIEQAREAWDRAFPTLGGS